MSSNLQITKICAFCGERFIAQKTSTRFCSHKCSRRAYKDRLKHELTTSVDIGKIERNYFSAKKPQKSSPTSKHSLVNLPTLNQKEYLSLRETAIVLGVGKSTVHRYCVAGILKCIRMNKRIVIRKKDLDGMFESAPPYRVIPRPVKLHQDKQQQAVPIDEYCSAKEIAQKYGYSKSAIHKMAERRKIPRKLFEGAYLYSKNHIEEVYQEKLPNESILEWYYAKEIMDIYSLSLNAVYGLVSIYKVPKCNNKGMTLYSKSHVDTIIQIRNGDKSIIEWYTMEDIYNQYMMQPSFIANFVFANKIPRKRHGTKALYSKTHFDEAVRLKNPRTEYISIRDAMERYNLSRDSLYGLMSRYDIPKIKNGKYVKIQRYALEKIINPKTLLNYGITQSNA